MTVVPTTGADDLGSVAGINHVPERVMQKSVKLLTVLGVIIDPPHGPVALERTWLNVLNFKPASLGEVLGLSMKRTHGS